jgi:hypothetical protein
VNIHDLPPHIKKLNPDLFGPVCGLETRKPEPAAAPPLDRGGRKHKGRPCCMVTLVVHTRRALDDDNLQGALKPLRDAIAGTLGIDDGDSRIHWEYGQVETRGWEGVAVKICL